MNSSLYGRPLGNVTFPVCCRIVREGFYWPSRIWWRLLSFPFIQADLRIVSGSSHQLGRNPSTFLGTSSRHKIPEIVRTNHSKLKRNLFSISVSPFGNTDVDKYEAPTGTFFLALFPATTPPPGYFGSKKSFLPSPDHHLPSTIPNKKPPVKPTQWLPLKILKDLAVSWFHIFCNWEEAECMMRARRVPTEARARRAEARYGCQLPLSVWAMTFSYKASNVWIFGNLPFPPVLCLCFLFILSHRIPLTHTLSHPPLCVPESPT